MGVHNSEGEFAIKPQFDGAEFFLNGLAKVRVIKGDWIYEGYLNRQGEYVVKPAKKRMVEKEDAATAVTFGVRPSLSHEPTLVCFG